MMKVIKPLLFLTVLALLVPAMSQAYDANWKRGHVYYRMICTACHSEQGTGKIAPNSRTRAEWEAYLQADKHAAGKDTVSQYLSESYRASIAGENRAARKFARVPADQLAADLKALLMRSAKDGDAPTGCR